MGNELNIVNNKQIILYLAEKFPNCFKITGEIKPLKLGIFQDIIELLQGELPVSKTRLRMALRSYTSSYQYLETIKAENMRVDLLGQPYEKVADAHVGYAQSILLARKQKHEFFLKKKMAKFKQSKQTNISTSTTAKKTQSSLTSSLSQQCQNISKIPSNIPKINVNELKIGQKFNILVGKSNFNVTLLEKLESTLKVELATGLVITVSKSIF